MDANPRLEQRIAAVAALDQPLRRALYRLLTAASGWTSRDDAAVALGVPRSVAAFHLDKLVDAGVVEVRFERVGGRTGPGAGRPAKLYRPAPGEVVASVPERRYELAGSLLARAVADSVSTGAPVRDCVRAVSRTSGRHAGAARTVNGAATSRDPRTELVGVLEDHGYEPVIAADGEIALVNCPFHQLAEQQRDLVCGMNLDFLGGVLDGIGTDHHLTARLQPTPGYCCVRIVGD